VSWRGEVGAELEVVRERDHQASSWLESISSQSVRQSPTRGLARRRRPGP
jgi:hypothetical protein